MKKLFVLLAALSLSVGAAAQRFGSISEHTSLEINDWFEVNPLSYIYVGLKGPASLKDDQFAPYTSFGRSQEFGFNLVEFAIHPYRSGTIAVGLGLDWDYYKLNSGRMWVPNGPDKSYIYTASVIEPWGKIRQSTLSVMSFNIPLNFTQHFGSLAISVGATAELNLAGIHRFRGEYLGNEVNNRKSGDYFSKNIKTTLFTYDVHAVVAYGGLGLYFRYSPVSVLATEENPHFNTWTLGLILGLDI